MWDWVWDVSDNPNPTAKSVAKLGGGGEFGFRQNLRKEHQKTYNAGSR